MPADRRAPRVMSRRRFLRVAALAGAAAGAASMARYGDLDSGLFSPFGPASADERAVGPESWVSTTCWIGKQECGVLARVVDGRLVKLEGNPLHPRNRGT